ncbi:hypothetical protein IPH25_00525 [bacterium]|nr:MAG: hypothetical protein IPG37_02640 [bacterium]QQR61918.1 MAG: hypothetical protein IPH25_00525 [bacterium]QQR62492.1 MAG: hypothetical protein IPH67_03660 [bacterium]
MNIKLKLLGFFLLAHMFNLPVQVFAANPAQEIVSKVTDYLRKHSKLAKGAAITSVILFLARQYYFHKTKPKAETISEAARIVRWQEILDEKDVIKKIKLLISYVDDFYVFGTRTKTMTKKIVKMVDGEKVILEDKEVIKGTGLVTFLYDNIFDKFEDYWKFNGTFAAVVFTLLALSKGEGEAILSPMNGNK